ncbi:uncharacterized protein LOC120904585 [Anopheles arabiensis]|uniref:uncharacterized protein LOC120904585 n=1 Tax=Anopheles arabiensis TaxID=7173 RepID=UPI001AACAB7E|nr:uncharacterized protein LOC120904585 [Anopheles arabiensis]XP_040170612.1 uncharacterized protein LOC120904585 [Anopheles arabiensis]
MDYNRERRNAMRYNTANATTRRFHGENARRDTSTNQNMSSESSFQPRSTRRRRRFRRRRNCNNANRAAFPDTSSSPIMEAVASLINGTQNEDIQMCMSLATLFRRLPSDRKIAVYASIQTYIIRQLLGAEHHDVVSDPCIVDVSTRREDLNSVEVKRPPEER